MTSPISNDNIPSNLSKQMAQNGRKVSSELSTAGHRLTDTESRTEDGHANASIDIDRANQLLKLERSQTSQTVSGAIENDQQAQSVVAHLRALMLADPGMALKAQTSMPGDNLGSLLQSQV